MNRLKKNRIYQVNPNYPKSEEKDELLYWMGFERGEIFYILNIIEIKMDFYDLNCLNKFGMFEFGLSEYGLENDDSMFIEIE